MLQIFDEKMPSLADQPVRRYATPVEKGTTWCGLAQVLSETEALSMPSA
jgi:hypothetical protein